MRLPRKVIIDGKEWTVVKNPQGNGACFTGGTSSIVVGTHQKNKILENFLHEILEATLTYNHLRYTNMHSDWNNGDLRFAFNHQQFEKVCSDLALAIKDIVKEK